MGLRKLAVITVGGAYVLAVLLNDHLIRHAPKAARYFAPPFFQFSESVSQGHASPFEVGMSEARALAAARSAGLVRRPCHPGLKMGPRFDYPAALCFAFPATGTFWDIWVANHTIALVNIYTTFNVTSD